MVRIVGFQLEPGRSTEATVVGEHGVGSPGPRQVAVGPGNSPALRMLHEIKPERLDEVLLLASLGHSYTRR